MRRPIDILVIDDDRFSQKLILRALNERFAPRTADNGASGIASALETTPDIILLDVEMPGMNGYEVCDRLRNQAATSQTPIVFLSSHSSLRERMQGYEAGADDYLVKPFEPEHLVAKLGVILKYREQQREMQAQYEMAQKTAYIAMTGSSEMGQALAFVEKSYNFVDFDELAQGLFTVTDRLTLNCVLRVICDGGDQWFGSAGSVKPLEQELMALASRDKRFFDFGSRTIIFFPQVSLLVKNMPLDDMERYGRIKDLLPMVLSAVNAKALALNAEQAIRDQGRILTDSLTGVKNTFLELAKSLAENQQKGTLIMRRMLHGLTEELPGMGLDEDQEEYILHRIDAAIEEAMRVVDTGDELRTTFAAVVNNLQQIVDRQKGLLDALAHQQPDEDEVQDNYTMDVELF